MIAKPDRCCYAIPNNHGNRAMGIDKHSDLAANIQIGPTDQGMVRIYIEAEGGIELPLDFDPEEAEEIAEELRAAATAARGVASGKSKPKKR